MIIRHCTRTAEHPLKLNALYDALFCLACDEWVEAKCKDDHCLICRKRPARPSLAPIEVDEVLP